MMNLYSKAFAPSSAAESRVRTIAVKVVNRGLRRLPQQRPSATYDLFGFPLRIPISHPLPRILATDTHYLRPLTVLAQAVASSGCTAPAVDIGANVGDTAVLMAEAGLTHVLCVEGNETFLGHLRTNAAHGADRGWNLVVVDKFVGEPSADEYKVETRGGTAWIVESDDNSPDAQTAEFISPADLVESVDAISLLKIDTDGMDLRILSQILEASADCPVESVFVEFTPEAEPINNAFDLLGAKGLDVLYWFDHSGHLVCSTAATDSRQIAELTHFGKSANVYFDIAAVRGGSAVAAAIDSAVQTDS